MRRHLNRHQRNSIKEKTISVPLLTVTILNITVQGRAAITRKEKEDQTSPKGNADNKRGMLISKLDGLHRISLRSRYRIFFAKGCLFSEND